MRWSGRLFVAILDLVVASRGLSMLRRVWGGGDAGAWA